MEYLLLTKRENTELFALLDVASLQIQNPDESLIIQSVT